MYAVTPLILLKQKSSLVAYFVVFFKNGFSPSDLRKAQLNGGKFSVWSDLFAYKPSCS